MSMIKSKKRVADHGEVFTPPTMVNAMLDLVKDEVIRFDSRFLEPACGSGNFLVCILQRRLSSINNKLKKQDSERLNKSLFSLMCIYGIEVLMDNVKECRTNLIETFARYADVDTENDYYRAASRVTSINIVHGDAIEMKDSDKNPISFAEWSYAGCGKFGRRDFRLDTLTGSSELREEGKLFSTLAGGEVFPPVKEYPCMTVRKIATAEEFDCGGVA